MTIARVVSVLSLSLSLPVSLSVSLSLPLVFLSLSLSLSLVCISRCAEGRGRPETRAPSGNFTPRHSADYMAPAALASLHVPVAVGPPRASAHLFPHSRTRCLTC